MASIAHIQLPPGAGLAPMAGVTDLPTRLIAHEQGAAFSVSEMLSAKGVLYSPFDRGAAKEILRAAPHQGICGLQLFGSEPSILREAANRMSDAGFDFIDLNMGCPAPKITSNGEGSALMKTPLLAAKVIAAAVAGARVPVTVKIRSGWDEGHINAVQIAKIAQCEGAAALTVHARTRQQMYTGRADRAVIAEVKANLSIPVFGNGDIACGQDALSMIQSTGCDGVMVGRAAQGNPWIFRDIACALIGQAAPQPTAADRIGAALRHLDMSAALTGERAAIREMRKQIAWYLSGLRGCVRVRDRINRIESIGAVRETLFLYLSELTD